MRSGIIAAAVLSLGITAVPSMLRAGEVRDRHEDVHVVRHDVRPVEVRHDEFRHDEIRRDVRVDERVVVDHGYRHWDHDRVYIPAPVVTVDVAPVVTFAPTPVVVAPCVTGFIDTPVSVGMVPPAVLNSLAAQTGGAPIVSVDWLHNGPAMYYDMHVAGPNGSVQTLRFGLRGVFYGYI